MIELLLLNINQSLLVIDLVWLGCYMLRFFTGSDFRDSSRPSRQSSFLRALLLSFLPPSCCAHMLRPPASISCLHLPHKIKLGTALGRSPAHFFCAGCFLSVMPQRWKVSTHGSQWCPSTAWVLRWRLSAGTGTMLCPASPRRLSSWTAAWLCLVWLP